jgi:hypothetical protein
MKRILFVLMILVSMSVWTVDLSFLWKPVSTEMNQGKGEVIPDPNSLPELTWEELEGQNYEILSVTPDFIIVKIGDKYYVVYK